MLVSILHSTILFWALVLAPTLKTSLKHLILNKLHYQAVEVELVWYISLDNTSIG